MKKYFLYNPKAGNNQGESKINELKKKATASDEFINILEISDYSAFIRNLDVDDQIVICGGDGTLNCFVNYTQGIIIKNEIYYYATGTGNDFLKDIIGKTSSEEPILISQYLNKLPVVKVNGQSYQFINGIGYGIDGYCCEVADKIKAKSNRKINYTVIAIKGLLFHYRPTTAKVVVNGKKYEFKKVWIAPTMNGRYYGGGMMPTPNQDRLNEDHSVSLMVMHRYGRLRTLMAFPTIFKGEHIKKNKLVTIFKGKNISVEFNRPVALQIDGETYLNVSKYEVTTFDA